MFPFTNIEPSDFSIILKISISNLPVINLDKMNFIKNGRDHGIFVLDSYIATIHI